mmetsp:Transcript_29454/g.54056  ORF Transcript_29454/g.54056 Transcript_29454/m.54056 type:complete len:115 (+) Transcript_29454:281-625(+)
MVVSEMTKKKIALELVQVLDAFATTILASIILHQKNLYSLIVLFAVAKRFRLFPKDQKRSENGGCRAEKVLTSVHGEPNVAVDTAMMIMILSPDIVLFVAVDNSIPFLLAYLAI